MFQTFFILGTFFSDEIGSINHLHSWGVCVECNKANKTAGDLKKHTTIHNGKRERLFLRSLSDCKKSLLTAQSLENHERIHTGIKLFACQECKQTFGHLSTLRGHIKVHKKIPKNIFKEPVQHKFFKKFFSENPQNNSHRWMTL